MGSIRTGIGEGSISLYFRQFQSMSWPGAGSPDAPLSVLCLRRDLELPDYLGVGASSDLGGLVEVAVAEFEMARS